MMKNKLLTTLAAIAFCGAAAAQTDTLAVDTTLTLGEVTVNGMRTIQKVDRTLFLPTKKMARSSANGYDLLKLMMLPGIKVDPVQQTVSSLRGGGVQVRINDVKAGTQDILSLQPTR